MHLGIVLTWLAKYIDDVSMRCCLMSFPTINHSSHLHSGTDLQFLTAGAILCHLENLMHSEHISGKRLQESGFILRLSGRLSPDIVPSISLRIAESERN